MKVEGELVEKVVRLHDSEHKGFRKIGEALGISKSEAYRIYKKHGVAFKEEMEKAIDGDEEYKVLKKEEAKLEKEVRMFKAKEEVRERVKTLCLKKSETSDGLQEIFGSPQKMLEFARATVDYESWMLKGAKVWESFESYCQIRKLPLAETLFEIVGSMSDYKADADEDGTLVLLNNYVGLQLDFFFEEEKQKKRQKEFWTGLLSFECPDCGGSIQDKTMWIDGSNGQLCCKCGNAWKLLCTNCKSELKFDTERKVFHCPICAIVFSRDLESSAK